MLSDVLICRQISLWYSLSKEVYPILLPRKANICVYCWKVRCCCCVRLQSTRSVPLARKRDNIVTKLSCTWITSAVSIGSAKGDW